MAHDEVSKAALELRKNLPNSRILTWPPGVGISDALIGQARLLFDSSEELVIVANTKTQIDMMVGSKVVLP